MSYVTLLERLGTRTANWPVSRAFKSSFGKPRSCRLLRTLCFPLPSRRHLRMLRPPTARISSAAFPSFEFCSCLFIFERERDSMSREGAERGGDTESEAGSRL